MPVPDPHCDLSAIDLTTVLADEAAIAKELPHRYELAQLTAVVHIDPAQHLIVGYRDIRADEFWVRGHFPGKPVFPGVLMCEAAAQLSCYYTQVRKVTEGLLIGLSGIEECKFRRAVVPGDRLVLVGKGSRVKPRMTIFNVQGYVGTELAFHVDILGMPIGRLGDM